MCDSGPISGFKLEGETMDSNLSTRCSNPRIPKLPVSPERLTDPDMDLVGATF